MTIQRCCNPNNLQYIHYGGRGIKICDEWLNDFKAFYDYVISLEGYDKNNIGQGKLTIDRINNDGNYEPGNLRWADQRTQSTNSRRNRKCKYIGVYFRDGKYYYQISYHGCKSTVGPFDSEINAAKARDRYIIDFNIDPIHLQIFKKV